jgi:hypothetical protein
LSFGAADQRFISEDGVGGDIDDWLKRHGEREWLANAIPASRALG